MKARLFSLFVCFCLCVSSSACFESQNPLSAPEKSLGDKSLKGVWYARLDGNDVYLHVIPLDDPWLKVIQVSHINIGGSYDLEFCEIFPTKFNGLNFLNMSVVQPVKSPNGEEGTEKRYGFFKYELKGDVLTIWGLNYEELKQDLAEKRSVGGAGKPIPQPSLKDAGENLLKYLASPEAESKFQLYGVFRRVKFPED